MGKEAVRGQTATIDRAFWYDLAREVLERQRPVAYLLAVRRLAGSEADERIAKEEFRRAVKGLTEVKGCGIMDLPTKRTPGSRTLGSHFFYARNT